MGLQSRLTNLAFRPHLPRRTVRLRLTLLYGCLFLASGAGLLAITYVLVENRLSGPVTSGGSLPHSASSGIVTTHGSARNGFQSQQAADLHQLLIQSSIALAIMAVVSIGLGWLMAGRTLRPLRSMTVTARRISEHNLHERLALPGPDDELTDLGDTIDGLLARLETAFDSQRAFVANASHELRTPLMLTQTLLQVALADPAITLDSLRAACEEVIDVGKEQAQLIEALLILARSQQGLEHNEPVDLAAVTGEVLHAHEPAAVAKGLHVDAAVSDATIVGDARLVYSLVSNLVDNAIRHNIAGGHVQVAVAANTARATLSVSNTGPRMRPDQVDGLLQPFQRGRPDRTASPDGLGLGLSVVAAIATAHGAALSLLPGDTGGLDVEVHFDRRPADDANVATRNGRHPPSKRQAASL